MNIGACEIVQKHRHHQLHSGNVYRYIYIRNSGVHVPIRTLEVARGSLEVARGSLEVPRGFQRFSISEYISIPIRCI
jgi:hypothetical protein